MLTTRKKTLDALLECSFLKIVFEDMMSQNLNFFQIIRISESNQELTLSYKSLCINTNTIYRTPI